MSDLAKLVSDIRRLSKAEAERLIGLLAAQWNAEIDPAGVSPGTSADDVTSLSEEDWLVAEAISLKAEAVALSRSLDDTLDYVRSRCQAIVEVR